MAKSSKPNILVIWGDDIGISNLSCYSHGLMGYKTPNIDRIAEEGMMFTDSYGEQSCTAGRSSFITGQSVYRTGLSKVGIPGAPVGMQEKHRHHRRLPQEPGLRDRPVRQEPSRRSQPHAADQPRLRRVLRQSLSSQRRRRARIARLSQRKGFPELPQSIWTARGDAFLGDRHGRPDRGAALGQSGQAESDRHRPAHQEAHGDLRRRFRCGGEGFHQAGERRRQAVLRLAQHHAHASQDPHQAREHRAGGTLAVALPRYDDRPRQEHRPDARLSRRARHSPTTPSSCTRPTTART